MTLNHNALNNSAKTFEFVDTEGRLLARGERLVGICTHLRTRVYKCQVCGGAPSLHDKLTCADAFCGGATRYTETKERETYSFMPKDRQHGACDFWCESTDILAIEKIPG